MAGSILLYFGPRRSVVCSSQPRRPTGVGKKKKETHYTPQSRCPNIDISRLDSLWKSGGQDEKQRYGIEDNLHLGERDRERVCVCVFSFFQLCERKTDKVGDRNGRRIKCWRGDTDSRWGVGGAGAGG